MKREQIRRRFAVMNNAYASYSFDFFLDSMEKLGLNKIDLWGGVQHYNPCASARERELVRRKIADRGMEVVAYTPELLAYPYNFASPDLRTRRASVDYAVQNLERAAELACGKMLISPGWGLLDVPIQKSRDWACDALERVAAAAGGIGVRLVLEHLTPQSSNLLCSVEAVCETVARVGRPELGVVLDLGQMHVFGEAVSDYASRLGERLWHVHMMDGLPACHLAFGDGVLPLESDWKALGAWGYEGVCTLEINDGRYGAHPHEALLQCVNALLNWSD